MANFGIICETNPMHNGHKYLIDKARELGASRIVCVMSGNTVQRGEFAVTDKYTRAEALLKCGADLVLELPFPWCSGSAEYFATAGVYLISEFCDTLIFGSECGDIDALTFGASLAASDSFKQEYSDRLSKGEPATGAYYDMLSSRVGYSFLSNDVLGLEYIKAAKKLSLELSFKTVSRKGDGYLSEKINDKVYPSATAIRRLWLEGDIKATEEYIPKEAFDVYLRAFDEGRMADMSALDAFWLSFFRLHEGGDFSKTVGVDGGIANRFCTMSKKAHDTTELLKLVKNKRYTDASLQRAMLYCLAGVTRADLASLPEEALLLAANKNGRALMSERRKENGIQIVTKPADIDRNARQNILSERINSVYALAYKKLSAEDFMKMKPYIEK